MTRKLVLVLVAAVSARSAAAHEKHIHQEIPTIAYEIMRLAERDPSLLATPGTLPPGVTAADWNAFRTEVIAAAPAVRGWTPGLTPLGRTCYVERNNSPMTLLNGFNAWKTLADVDEPISWTYPQGLDCGVFSAWAPDGIYAGNGGIASTDYTGLTLGHFAASVDDELDDTHIWYRPTHVSPPLPGVSSPIEVAEALDKGIDLGLTVLLAPFVCIADLLSGGGNCLSHAHDIADTLNPIDELVGSIPGIGDHADAKYVGFWHHINVTPGQSNTYDDVQGMYLDEATFLGRLDVAELAVIAFADTLGQGIHYRTSSGPKRYQVANGRDGHPNTRLRSDGEWQFLNYPHTPMEPVDNLAFFGWQAFRAPLSNPTARQARWLGWPLHALGDATAPHHVIGAPGWGHRPSELAVDKAWPKIRYNDPADTLLQRAQARRIFSRALRWRKLILDWRAADPVGRKENLPIRDLVTALARESFDYSMAQEPLHLWPYDPVSSAVNFLDEEDLAGHDRVDLPDLARPLLENSIGATLAFLTFATEVN